MQKAKRGHPSKGIGSLAGVRSFVADDVVRCSGMQALHFGAQDLRCLAQNHRVVAWDRCHRAKDLRSVAKAPSAALPRIIGVAQDRCHDLIRQEAPLGFSETARPRRELASSPPCWNRGGPCGVCYFIKCPDGQDRCRRPARILADCSKKRLPPLTSGGTDSDWRRFAEMDLGVHLAAQNNAPD